MHPYLIHSVHLLLPTFGVLAALGLMAALALSLRTAVLTGLSPDKLWNAGLVILLSAFGISRLLIIVANPFRFFIYPLLVLTLPSFNPTEMLLTLIAALIYLRRKQLPLLDTLDAWSPCATLVWFFLALGHFAEGTDVGLPTGLPWGMPIPPDAIRLHPVALYAALAAAALTVILLRQLRHRKHSGDTFALALAATGIIQFLLTFFRQPYPYLAPSGALLDPIQWIALTMIALAGLVLILRPGKLVAHAI